MMSSEPMPPNSSKRKFSSDSSTSSKSSKGLGNTSPTPKKKQISPAKRWSFTCFDVSGENIKDIMDVVDSSKSSIIMGKEVCPDTGNLHIQGYIEFSKKVRPKNLFKDITIHWEKSKGNRESNIEYCKKDGHIIYQNFYEEIYTEEISEKMKFLPELMDAYSFPKGDRKIHFCIDKVGGCGKTECIRSLIVSGKYKDVLVTGGKSADMKNQVLEFNKATGRFPKYIFVDVPRSCLDYISYTGLEEIKNMLFYSGKYEGGMVVGNKPFLCVMMNEVPDYEKLSEDRFVLHIL
jgi:hypothetical protein